MDTSSPPTTAMRPVDHSDAIHPANSTLETKSIRAIEDNVAIDIAVTVAVAIDIAIAIAIAIDVAIATAVAATDDCLNSLS